MPQSQGMPSSMTWCRREATLNNVDVLGICFCQLDRYHSDTLSSSSSSSGFVLVLAFHFILYSSVDHLCIFAWIPGGWSEQRRSRSRHGLKLADALECWKEVLAERWGSGKEATSCCKQREKDLSRSLRQQVQY